MKLFYANGTCSIGIHALIEEVGISYEPKRVNFVVQEQLSPAFVAINPKSKVPMLQRDDGSVLTEWPAIATWIAHRDSAKRLLPEDEEGQVRAIEVMDYVVATVHMQGFSRYARPGNFAPNEADHEVVKARGLEIFGKGVKFLDQQLAGKDFIVGNKLSIADFAVFYVSLWAIERLKQQLPSNLAAHYARMKQRPAVQRVLADEGFQT